MSALSQIGSQVYAQMTEGYNKVTNGYRDLISNKRNYHLYNPSSKIRERRVTAFGLKQALATSLSITFIVGSIFRLIGATSIPSLTIGLAAGLMTFAHQCYIYDDNKQNNPPKSVGLSVYFICAYSFNKVDGAVQALVSKCRALWNAKKEEGCAV